MTAAARQAAARDTTSRGKPIRDDVERLTRTIDAHYIARVATMVTTAQLSRERTVTVDRVALLYMYADLEHASAEAAPYPWDYIAAEDEPLEVRGLRRRLEAARRGGA